MGLSVGLSNIHVFQAWELVLLLCLRCPVAQKILTAPHRLPWRFRRCAAFCAYTLKAWHSVLYPRTGCPNIREYIIWAFLAPSTVSSVLSSGIQGIPRSSRTVRSTEIEYWCLMVSGSEFPKSAAVRISWLISFELRCLPTPHTSETGVRCRISGLTWDHDNTPCVAGWLFAQWFTILANVFVGAIPMDTGMPMPCSMAFRIRIHVLIDAASSVQGFVRKHSSMEYTSCPGKKDLITDIIRCDRLA